METTLKDLVLQVSLTCRRTFGHKLRVSLAPGGYGDNERIRRLPIRDLISAACEKRPYGNVTKQDRYGSRIHT